VVFPALVDQHSPETGCIYTDTSTSMHLSTG